MSITRRTFLKQGAVAVAGVTLARANFVSAAPAPKKVLIIGAGMAGLVAGYELTQLGHEITILEARMRPGGRVHTLREPFSDGLFAEAGAARIPTNHDLTLKYAKLLEVGLEPMYPSRLSALRLDDTGAHPVPIEGFTEDMGRHFGDELGGIPTRWSKIQGGSDMLPRAFAKRLANKIIYGSPVVRLEQDDKAARAVFLHGGTQQTLSADRILCALPFSVLRNVELPATFPEAKLNLIKTLRYDSVCRVYLQAKKRSWEEKGLNGFAVTKNSVEIWQPTWNQPGPRGILMTYNRSGEAERVGSMKESERISSTLAQLDGYFSGLRENFEGGASKYWAEDEWARGAWAFAFGPGFIVGSKPEGRIHFAGEHLSQNPSWMQGALSSGLRTVKEINEAA